jgi:5-methylcytosine-specific restriction endonuclease McrA
MSNSGVSTRDNVKAEVIKAVCDALQREGAGAAKEVARHCCPFLPKARTLRQYRASDALRVFIRDGFIDRYSGQRLVFPGVLRLLSEILKEDFPFHPNWRTDLTHAAYWSLFPTVDHIGPVSKAGADNDQNWVTTSQLKNSAKGNWTLGELGWDTFPPGKFEEWDGLLGWFLDYVKAHPEHLRHPYLKAWYAAGVKCLDEYRATRAVH